MSEQISTILKKKLDDLATYGELNAETEVNALKGELQYYVLNFIYHHSEYSNWIMYGGTALRMIHDLDRMSVDLDFEIDQEVKNDFLKKLKTEMEKHFSDIHGIGADFLTIKTIGNRSLVLKFRLGKLVSGFASEWVHVKVDLNHFAAPKTVREHRTINRGQFSFVIVTYNMATLMASKIAAIFLREQRGVDKNIYDYKGRDIYDLLWYMSKKIVPDFDYLIAKHIDIRDPKALFNKLTIDILNYEKMDDCLKDDLAYLFENPFQFSNWFNNWRNNYLRLLDAYKIRTVAGLECVRIHHDIRIGTGDNYIFQYRYHLEGGGLVYITFNLYEDWIIYGEGNLSIEIDKELEGKIEFSSNGLSSRSGSEENKLKQYATLFYHKTQKYFKKTNKVVIGEGIVTKVIRMIAEKNFNPKEQILLNKSALTDIGTELDDLLK